MKKERTQFDVVVVGAGSSGAALSLFLAQAGYRVALVEARNLAQAGACWVNGVAPVWFSRAELPVPHAPTLRGGQGRFISADLNGRNAVDNGPFPLLNIDMRLFTQSFIDQALRAGVTAFDQTQPLDFHFAGERPVSLSVERQTRSGAVEPLTLKAALFVDATGNGAVLRKRVPALARHTPPIGPKDTCAGHMLTCELRDPAKARAYLDEHGLRERDVYTRMGVDGGFSTFMLEIDLHHGVIEFISGTIADGTHASGEELISRFRAEHDFVGEPLFGGGGLFPVHRPYDRFSAPGIACVGLSASQIFPANGSGTGAGLYAARRLAESLKQHSDPGSLDATWRYQADFMRGMGGILGAYDAVRRSSAALSGAEVASLFEAGLMIPENTGYVMRNELLKPSLTEGIKRAPGALRALSPAARFLGGVFKMPLLARLYAHYPQSPSLPALKRWAAWRAFVLGDASDLR